MSTGGLFTKLPSQKICLLCLVKEIGKFNQVTLSFLSLGNMTTT